MAFASDSIWRKSLSWQLFSFKLFIFHIIFLQLTLTIIIYTNDLSNGVSSNCKLFADDTSLFSVVNDTQTSTATLRNDQTVISNWTFQWKMIFNPDLTKQAQEVIFNRKTKKLLHPYLSFNEIPLKNSISQKHLGFTLDVKLNFVENIKNITKKLIK